MSRLSATCAAIWRLASPYFVSEDRRAGRTLLACVVLIELSLVGINVMINRWQSRFYNALQDRAWDAFVNELMFFSLLAAAYVILAVYQLYLQQWLLIRWRAWMTHRYLERWLGHANHYRMQLLGDVADNPDQRIAEDIKLFADKAILIGIRILSAVVTLISFVVILWGLSADAPLQLFGREISIPGYLVFAALVYAVIGTLVTHWIGRPLIGLNVQQQRYEADFRFHLVRVRENSEQIALLRGEEAENAQSRDRFNRVIVNWRAIMSRLKRLTMLTASYQQVSVVFPFLMVSPAYFAGKLQLGALMQTASAFESVRGALSVFIDVYRELAEWQAAIARLEQFEASIAQADRAAQGAITVSRRGDGAFALRDLDVRLPEGKPLMAADLLTVARGDRVLVSGASGSGKSTLLRTIAGVWPFGTGTVEWPAGATVMALPQRPYFPVATLAAALSYPDPAERFSRARLAEVLADVGLPDLVPRLDDEAHWNRILSLGEQQRLAVARALLQRPDVLLLDEATASLDEEAEASLYTLLKDRLPDTSVMSTGHRSTLAWYHDRQLALGRVAGASRLREIAATATG